MRRNEIITGLLLILLPLFAFAQTLTKHSNHKDSVYAIVELQPEFPGGMAAMGLYLSKALDFSDIRKYQAQGRLWVSFVVDRNGYLRNIKAINGVKGTGNSTFEKRIALTIEKMPRWKPGRRKGKTVNVRYNLPLQVETE